MPLNRKIAYIDLTTGDIQTKPIPLDVRKKFLREQVRPGNGQSALIPVRNLDTDENTDGDDKQFD